MMFKESILCGFIMLLLPILITGCVVSTYQYEAIDYNTLHPNLQPEFVYIPRYRPRPMYLYGSMWYTEPYTIVVYEDDNGYRKKRKVPNSKLRMEFNRSRPYLKRKGDVESIMKRVNEERKKRRYNMQNRRKKIKVLERSVDTYNIGRKRRMSRGRKKNEAMGKT